VRMRLYPYSKRFAPTFNKERRKISAALGKCEIQHVGSTAVPGLGGKGIVDIMIALDNWKGENEVIEKLRSLGFKHIHPKQRGWIFLSRTGPTKYGDTHLHLVKKGSYPYREMLTFRDHMRSHPKEAERYWKLKLSWFKETRGVRRRYTAAKESYVKNIWRRSRQQHSSSKRCSTRSYFD